MRSEVMSRTPLAFSDLSPISVDFQSSGILIVSGIVALAAPATVRIINLLSFAAMAIQEQEFQPHSYLPLRSCHLLTS